MPALSATSQPNLQDPAKLGNRARTLAAYQAWILKHDWEVFGTLNFVPNRKANIDTAMRQWRRVWNQVDRLVYGNTGLHQHRVERIVCTQFGSLGSNPHIHFLAKSPIISKDFCVYLNALWANTTPEAAPPSSNEILPLLDVKKATNYLLHEYWLNGPETFNAELTYLNTDEQTQLPRPDAASRLKAATKGIWLSRAHSALETHLEIANARYNKRNAH